MSAEIFWWCVCAAGNAWLIMHTMEYLIEISEKRQKRILMLSACFLLDRMVIFIGDPFNILMTIPCFLFAIWISCKGSLWKKMAIGLMYASTFFAFNAIRDNYIFNRLSKYCYLYQIRWGTSACSIAFALLLYISIRKFAPDKDYGLSDNMWKLLLLLTATPFGIVLSVVALYNINKGSSLALQNHHEYPVILAIALLSFISLFWCMIILAKQQKLERQNMFMEINSKYYASMEQQHFEIRRLKHDLANHLQALSALPPKQRDEYVKDLAAKAASTQSLPCCGDATVNAVLSVKKNLMERHGIRMEMAVDIPEGLPYGKTDICALFANALDNAIEACMKLDGKQRTITLKSKAQKGLFCLEISNPIADADPNTAKSKGKPYPLPKSWKAGHFPPTSKTDALNHGFGLKSIQEIVERYHGKMEIKAMDSVFDLFLYIPLE